MEKIFSCNLNVEGKNVEYHVVFNDEKYTFIPEKNSDAPTFSFTRNSDWVEVDRVDPHLNKQAINQLEKYLLSQH